MKIAIVGAGAMGALFGARLAHHGHRVLLVDTWPEHVEAIQSDGLQVEDPGYPPVCRLPAVTRAAGRSPADLVVLLVKANRLHEALTANIDLVGPETPVVTLANGLGTAEVVAEVVGPERTVSGATALGAILPAPGRVAYTVPGDTYIGPFRGPVTPAIAGVGDAFNAAGLPTLVSDRVEEYIWNKLIINAAYNALGAITRLTNGQVAALPEGRRLLSQLVAETAEVARRLGIPLHEADPVQYCLDLGGGPIGPNPSSMLQDVLRQRPTEVDFINGAVARLARELGLAAPANELVTALVHMIERTYD